QAAPERRLTGTTRIVVESPRFGESQARDRCGISGGTALYVPFADAWLVDDGRRSALVSAERRVEVRGSARPLAEALMEGDPVTVSSPEDLQGDFAKQGLKASASPEKGGGSVL